MAERRANNKASLGNTTISTLTMIENVQDFVIFAKGDDESVGDGEGKFEWTLLEDAVDNDNANIE